MGFTSKAGKIPSSAQLIYTYSLWSDSAQRHTPLTLRWERETGQLITPARQIAQHSAIGWGSWNHSKTIKTSYGPAFWVSTPGHGGFILATQTKILGIKPDYRSFLDLSVTDTNTGQFCPCYIYTFEEDCGWALLLGLDPVAFASFQAYEASWKPESTIESLAWNIRHFIGQYHRDYLPLLQNQHLVGSI